MRRKKHKSTRRTVRFFKIAFGFKEPFRVLVDGNFLHAYRIACQGQAPLQEALTKFLGAPVKLFISKCITKELRELGEDMIETGRLAKRICKGAECPHQGREWGAAACITSLIGEANHEHFFIATQDVSLRKELGKIPAAPRIFLHANGLMLEEPSEAQENSAKQHEEAHNSIGNAEHEILEGVEVVREKSIFRRKKAKGPNPLAVKKSTKKKEKNKVRDSANSKEKKAKRPRRKKKSDGEGEQS